jgi:porphobilinogen synthase
MPEFPFTRTRRLRASSAIRNMVQEASLSTKDLIAPVFVSDAEQTTDVVKMPHVKRYCLKDITSYAEELVNLGIETIALFPVIDRALKDTSGSYALNPNGIIPKSIKLLKDKLPELQIIADLALDPYTTHGHDGIINDNNEIDNDQTSTILAKKAVLLAQSGVDIVAPSDMMDGRVRKIRNALEENNFFHTMIMSYSVKYASALYGPFRSALNNDGLSISKKTYQQDFHNSKEALLEIELDINEGADLVIVKPAGFYTDIIYRAANHFNTPIIGYQVSGEYAMLVEQSQEIIYESLISLKRAGASAIITYFAEYVAKNIKIS